MHKIGEKLATSTELNKEALNCIENLLVREEINIDTYELLMNAIKLLGCKGCYSLGEGIVIKLVDCGTNRT